MTIDLAICEWHPGSNRSMVDPVVAVARLEMPEQTRLVLIEKIKRHQFDDVVTIKWASIVSNDGTHQYDAAISNMNFADGRLCKSVTRKEWQLDHNEGALIYLVDGKAYGYAAACGNLFELVLDEKRPAPGGAQPKFLSGFQPDSGSPLDSSEINGPTASSSYGPIYQAQVAALAPPGNEYIGNTAGPGYFGGGYVVIGGGDCCPCDNLPPVTPVPEPSSFWLSVGGLLALSLFIRRFT